MRMAASLTKGPDSRYAKRAPMGQAGGALAPRLELGSVLIPVPKLARALKSFHRILHLTD
jgi:hypothetical protein